MKQTTFVLALTLALPGLLRADEPAAAAAALESRIVAVERRLAEGAPKGATAGAPAVPMTARRERRIRSYIGTARMLVDHGTMHTAEKLVARAEALAFPERVAAEELR